MAQLNGVYKETNIASMANVETLLIAYLTVQDTRMIALGGAATKIIGSLTITVDCEDSGAGTTRFVHRVVTALNCLSLADITTLIAALEVYIAAVLAESAYSADPYFDLEINTVMTS